MLLFVVLGCSGRAEDQAPPAGSGLLPPPEGEGVQLAMRSTVEPGQERAFCQYFVLPEEELDIARFEHALSPGSHHTLLWETSLTAADVDSRVGQDPEDCGARPERREGITSIVYGGQPGAASVSYPEDAALRMKPGTVMLLDHHVINTTDKNLEAEVRLNLWRAEPTATRRAGILHFYDWAIHVPPRATSKTEFRCFVPEALTIVFGHSHMHDRGTLYRAHRVSDGVRTPMFETRGPDSATQQFAPPFELEAGDAVEFECHYENPTEEAIVQGLSARENEMCSFTAGYATTAGERLPLLDEWCLSAGSGLVGGGELGCAGIDACLVAEADAATEPDVLGTSTQRCFLEGCPDATIPFTELVLCRARHCALWCDLEGLESFTARGHADPACQSCVETQCAAARAGCDAASCQP